MKKPFLLLEGEKVLEKIKPDKKLKTYFTLQTAFFLYLATFWLVFIAIPLTKAIGWPETITLAIILAAVYLIGLAVVVLIISWLLAENSYSYQEYWITNKRVLYKRGTFGYRISSVPLERISDVVVSRTMIERILGISSVLIESLAGQVGKEVKLLAIPQPEETQKLIFRMLSEKRKTEKLTM